MSRVGGDGGLLFLWPTVSILGINPGCVLFDIILNHVHAVGEEQHDHDQTDFNAPTTTEIRRNCRPKNDPRISQRFFCGMKRGALVSRNDSRRDYQF